MVLFREIFGTAGYVIEAIGATVIVGGIVLASFQTIRRLGRLPAQDVYQKLRQDIARSIILGLEFLIAGDIIRTVTVDQTLTGAAVLALIVLIRVALSITLHFEVEGRWPWQGTEETKASRR